MRRARFTYEGAYHHIMNRGLMGEKIFFDDKAKDYFLKNLKRLSSNLGIRILAYCIMDNHYHIILQNTSGKLSYFMKLLNGQFGIYYRKRVGGKGYVFQSRFKSTLIKEGTYLKMAIVYVLLNPVRKGITEHPEDYKWSSISKYFSGKRNLFADTEFVEEIFTSKKNLNKLLEEWKDKNLPVKKESMGEIIGDDEFILKAKERANRRKTSKIVSPRMRKYESEIIPVNKIIKDFEKRYNIKKETLKDIKSREMKRMRDELLILLKEKGGLKYSEIIKIEPFKKLKYSSLGRLYKLAKGRERIE